MIYTPTSLGGCGEELISDTSQLQKWTYLQLVSHLGAASSAVVAALISRAQQNNILSPSRYCSSLLEWSQLIGLSLTRASPAELPQGVTDFLQAVTNKDKIILYTDGSFELVRIPLLAALTLSRTDQGSNRDLHPSKRELTCIGAPTDDAYGTGHGRILPGATRNSNGSSHGATQHD